MTAWTQGYVDGLDYTYDFYRELTPSILNFAAVCRGQNFEFDTEHLTYCELGCGQGFSTNVLAAANPQIQFYANDFSPSHVAGARRVARLAQLKNVHFYEHPFSEFVHEPSLPPAFDIIALHGVYSWVSEENRREIIRFIHRKLKPGGLVYVSYNTLPGWASIMPLRRVLRDSFRETSGPVVPRINEALQEAQTLMDADAGLFKQNPALRAHYTHMMSMSRNYLAHEYLNEDWHPMYFRDVIDELSSAKISYVGSVDLLDQSDELLLTQDQQSLLKAEADPLKREQKRAFMINEQFRRDLFAKGSLPHSIRSNAGAWIDARFVLTREATVVSEAAKRRFASAPIVERSLQILITAIADGPATIRNLLGSPVVGASLSWGQVTDGIKTLVGAGYLHPCLPAEGEDDRMIACSTFNRAICNLAKESETLQFLASPVTGGGHRVDRFEQLFMLAVSDGKATADEWASYAWSILGPQGQKLLRDGKMIDAPEDNLDELAKRARSFQDTQLQTCVRLKIAL